MRDLAIHACIVRAGVPVVGWEGGACAAGKVELIELACVIGRARVSVVAGDVSKEPGGAAYSGLRVTRVEVAWILRGFVVAVVDGAR